MLYRLCSGPTDIPGLSGANAFGSRQLRTSTLNKRDRSIFGARVNDGAASAHATLIFRIANTEFEIKRDLKALNLISMNIDGNPRLASEEEYQNEVLEASNLESFKDWILILRYLVFYSEDRGSLVWDPDAQRQLLRLLFLPKRETKEYLERESEVLHLDTSFRNLRAVLSSQEVELKTQEGALAFSSSLEERIAELTNEQNVEQSQLDVLRDTFNEIDSSRQTARLDLLRAEDARESAYRAVERRRLLSLQTTFPSYQESAAYILNQLLAGDRCLACGSIVHSFAEELRQRVDEMQCVVCSSEITEPQQEANSDHESSVAREQLKQAETHLEATARTLSEAEEQYRTAVRRIQELEASIAHRSVELDLLTQELPDNESAIREKRKEFNALRARVEVKSEELKVAKSKYSRVIAKANIKIARQKEAIKAAFDRYASDFLVESCHLNWTTHKGKVGHSEGTIDFSVFNIDMTGTDFTSPVLRSFSDEVSESQREFIDLAFRMALVNVASEEGSGTLVIDAPEASLDAVFASRAADVLIRFGSAQHRNRVIITSNLVDGELIPTLLHRSQIRSRTSPRVIDLIRIASPTAAVRELRDEYERAIEELFRESGT